MRYLSLFDKLGFVYHLNHSKAKASDSANFCKRTFNSRAAVFTKLIGMSGLSNARVERLVGSGDTCRVSVRGVRDGASGAICQPPAAI